MNHLEKLIRQYYEWQGYLVKNNVKVGKLPHGGWEAELDIVAYHPQADALVHLEPSIDAHAWKKREQRYIKKFKAGKKYILKDIFPWLDRKHKIEQIAVLVSDTRKELAGGKVVSIDSLVSQIKSQIRTLGKVAKNAIPEEYDLLRTIQFTENGYHKIV